MVYVLRAALALVTTVVPARLVASASSDVEALVVVAQTQAGVTVTTGDGVLCVMLDVDAIVWGSVDYPKKRVYAEQTHASEANVAPFTTPWLYFYVLNIMSKLSTNLPCKPAT
eukprot:SAG31_NODE_10033_length_1193_cov_1.053931_2_plen_113_part_00